MKIGSRLMRHLHRPSITGKHRLPISMVDTYDNLRFIEEKQICTAVNRKRAFTTALLVGNNSITILAGVRQNSMNYGANECKKHNMQTYCQPTWNTRAHTQEYASLCPTHQPWGLPVETKQMSEGIIYEETIYILASHIRNRSRSSATPNGRHTRRS